MSIRAPSWRNASSAASSSRSASSSSSTRRSARDRIARARATSYGEPTSRQPLIADAQLVDRPGASPSARRTRAEGDLAAGLEGRRRVVRRRSRLSARPPFARPDVAGGDRDLDLGRQESGAGPAIPGLLGHGRVDRARRRLDLALGEADEGERRLRRATASVRLAQGRLGALEIAAQAADVADRVEPVGLRRRGVVGAELGRRPFELLLRPLPGAADGGDLGAMDPADTRETRTATGGRSTSRSPRSTRWPGGSRSCRGRPRSSGRRSPRS